MEYTVVLTDGSTGKVDDDTLNGQHPDLWIGEEINIHTYDENGNKIEILGIMAETLE